MGFLEGLIRRGRRGVGEGARGRVLDIGFGTGRSIAYYSPAVTSVVGVDLSLPMLREGRARTAAAYPVFLLEMDAERLAFADSSFDSVCVSLCLCTIPDPASALREALRVARPGAPMLFLEHVRSHLLPVALLQEALNPLSVWLQSDHLTRRTAPVVAASGVEVRSVERWALGFFNLIVGRKPGG